MEIEAARINSHIQMPKFMLKRFENENQSFFYYDIKKGFIGSKGHAKTFYTELGYYSEDTERYLSSQIETPFSNLLRIIDCIDFDSESFPISSELDKNVKQFIYALISRSPIMVSGIKKSSEFYRNYLSVQKQHDYAVKKGIELAKELHVFDGFFVTFAINKSPMPFVLPMCGLYNFKYNQIEMAFLPISPHVAIALVENKGITMFAHDHIISMLLIAEHSFALWFNKRAFSAQKETGCGYVISSEKAALEACIKDA